MDFSDRMCVKISDRKKRSCWKDNTLKRYVWIFVSGCDVFLNRRTAWVLVVRRNITLSAYGTDRPTSMILIILKIDVSKVWVYGHAEEASVEV